MNGKNEGRGNVGENSCKICEDDITDLLAFELSSSGGQKIVICDYCYQEFGSLRKTDAGWVTLVIDDDIDYIVYEPAPPVDTKKSESPR